MHQSANDILSISTNRETILIGPPGAFGVIHRGDVLVGRGEIEHAMAHIFTIAGIEDVMRSNARRFGMEASALKRLDGRALRAWLTGQAVRGALAIAIVPDPVVAFAAYVHRQEHAMDQASSLRRTMPEDEALPRDMERRFLIAMDMVPDHLHGEARKKFDDMVATVGMESIAVGLLIWLGAHFVPGLNLVVLAFDLFFLSGEVLRAMEMVGHCIEQVQRATKRSELEEIAKVLAAAIAVLVVNGTLSRLLRAKQVTRGQTQSTSRGRGGFDKPAVPRKPQQQTKRQPKKPPGPAGKAPAPANTANQSSGAGAQPRRPIDAPAVKKGMREAWADSQASDPAKRHEEGGYIVANPDGSLGVERWPRGQGASIAPPPRDAKGQYNGKKVLGEFHTHPNPPVDEKGQKWEQGGHQGDWNGIAGENYPGESYIISDGHIYTVDKAGKPNRDASGKEIPLGTRKDLIGK